MSNNMLNLKSYGVYSPVNIDRNFGYLRIDEVVKIEALEENNRDSTELKIVIVPIEDIKTNSLINLDNTLMVKLAADFEDRIGIFEGSSIIGDTIEDYFSLIDDQEKNKFLINCFVHYNTLESFYCSITNQEIVINKRQKSVSFDVNGYQKDWKYYDEVFFMQEYILVPDFDENLLVNIMELDSSGEQVIATMTKEQFLSISNIKELSDAIAAKFLELDNYMDKICLMFKIVYQNNYIFKHCDALFAFLGPRFISGRNTFELIMLSQAGQKVRFNNTPKELVPYVTGEIIAKLEETKIYDIKTEHQKAIATSTDINFIKSYNILQEVMVGEALMKFPTEYATIVVEGIELS